MRNYCAGYFNEETGEMNFWIQAEARIGEVGTKGYLITVPKLVFGSAGEKLHSQNVKQHLLIPLPLPQVEPTPDPKNDETTQPPLDGEAKRASRKSKRRIKRFFQTLMHIPFISYLIHN